jgi:alkylation response protein AidB-like acyl-CoA dehydrogenase
MERDLTDTERMLRDTFRSYFTTELEPHVPAMERGEELPYDLMRSMHKTLGLDAMLAPRGGREGGKEGAGLGLDANTVRYSRTTFTVEMSRVSPSFALSYGASIGLFGANVLSKGTPEQIGRFAIPVMRCARIGAWGLTEPGAGSDPRRQ